MISSVTRLGKEYNVPLSKQFKKIDKCRVCGGANLIDVLSLGELAVSDFVDSVDVPPRITAPLDLVLCDNDRGGCGLLQLLHTVSSELMYRKYWYRSGINQTMRDELHDIASAASALAGLQPNDYVIDIGSNDGTLLRSYSVKNIITVGFEPAENLYQFGCSGTSKIFVEFFNKSVWSSNYRDKKAKIITAIGMFYDLDDPNSFVADVYDCLDDEGVFVIQMMYMPYALERNAFDGICHEHLEYYTLQSLESLLGRHNLRIVDVQMREHINEGSVRFFIMKSSSIERPINDKAGLSRLDALRKYEEARSLNKLDTYLDLAKRVQQQREETMAFLKREVANGKVVHGYAASTKGNTTLQYYNIGPDLITAIADRNPDKWGKFTVLTGIPVISEEESRSQNPDYYFVLAWHFMPEFLEREAEFLEGGGKFIVPMPYFQVISH